MENSKTSITVDGKRRFACSPAAVGSIIVNEKEEMLMLTHLSQRGGWQVV
jgi:hypothetical protein